MILSNRTSQSNLFGSGENTWKVWLMARYTVRQSATVSAKEKRQIFAAAAARGISASEFMRQATTWFMALGKIEEKATK